MLISQILKNKDVQGVLTVAPGASVNDVVMLLSQKGVGAAIVTKDGVTPDGILTERDIVRELGRRGTACLADPVEDVMTTTLITCGPGERAIQVLQTMTDKRFRHMPVMDGAEMIGLVSIGDVVKARLEELAQQADSLKAMIMGY